ncbi:hypothetical protein HX109_03225 [Galbibacter sp. BG1]|uniref:beta strand repeat-containing protein n=1 Tax=Galbibacter sp. BG1 TaxID=1170699 RepID=UPI0015BC0311|nr:hypothetical protein [Galbibacter sp. BG1]QLE00618.1 hypothetical protein HX109_03225 [Galbibacter sp. BG1]
MKNGILLIVLLISGFAFSQTTVNLENQCNCTVLKGTQVTGAGATSPSADRGDIYINENTGVIYFWNGSSWDLTSGDKVKNQTFVVNTTEGTLVLTDSEGDSFEVLLSDIASEVDTNTTNASLTQDGTNLILIDSDNNEVTIPLSDIAAATDTNTTNSSFTIENSSSELVITDSDGNDVRIALADIATAVNTDNQDLANVLNVNNNAGGLVITNLGAPTNDADASTKKYVDDAITASNTADGDTDATNEIQTIASADNSVTATIDADNNYDLSVNAENTAFTSAQGLTSTNVQDAIDEVAQGSSDDQTASEVSFDDSTAALGASNTQAAIEALAASNAADNDTDDENELQDLSISGNELSLSNDPTATPIDLSGYLDNTDDQNASEVSFDDSTAALGASNTQAAIEALAASNAADNDTDDENELQDLSISGNELSLSNDPTATPIDLSGYLDNTDNQTASEVDITAITGITATNVQGALEELNSNSSDDQALTLETGNILTLEDGGTVNLTPFLDNTDEQDLSISGNELSLSNDPTATPIDLSGYLDNTDDQTASEVDITAITGITATNVQGALEELNSNSSDDQALTLETGNILTLEDGGTVNLTPFLDNTDEQDLSISGNELSLSNDPTATPIDLSGYLDNTDDQNASEVSFDDSTAALGASNTQAAIEALAASNAADNDTDDENELQDLSISGNELSLSNDPTATPIDLSGYLDNTDNQTASEVDITAITGITATNVQGALEELNSNSSDDQALTLETGNILTLEDGGTVNLTPFLDNTDEQDLSISGNELSLSNDPTATPIDLSGYLDNTDDQTASEVDITAITGITATNVQGALEELNSNSSDDQALTLETGNILTLEDGGTVNLTPFLDNTDEQDLSISGNELSLSNDPTATPIDLSGYLDNTDDQNASEVSFDDSTAALGASNTQAAIEALAASNAADNDTDDENELQDLSISGNELSLSNDPTATPIDLSGYLDNTDNQTASEVDITAISGITATNVQGALEELNSNSSDDQALTLETGNILTLEDGGTVNLTPFLDNTDEQDLSISGNELSLSNDPTATPIDLSGYLDNTDDQTASEVDITAITGITATNVQGALEELNSNSSDDQALTLETGNILTLEDGGTVNLTPFLDNTDEQDLSISGNELSLSNDPTATPIDLSGYLDNTDDQNASEVSFDDSTAALGASNTQAAIEALAASNAADNDTDDENELQDLSISGNELSLSNDPTATPIDLSGYLDNTDDQNASEVSFDDSTAALGASNTQAAIEALAASNAADNDTDDENELQDLSISGNELSLSNDPTATPIDLSGYLDNTDNQTASEVDITAITGITATNVQGALEELNSNSSDDQALTLETGNILTLEDGGTVNLTPFLDNTDEQDLSISGNELSLSNDPTATPIDLSGYLDNTDDQTASEVDITAISGITATNVQGALEELNSNSSDDQKDSEVELATPINVDGDGDPNNPTTNPETNETTVQEALVAMTKVTAKAARIFYPPSIALDASSTGPKPDVNLYADYVDQYGTPMIASGGAPAAIPTYAANELYYYITYYDQDVFENVSVSSTGVLSYSVKAVPSDYNSLINVVFVVK